MKGVSVVRLHFSADPAKADPKWEAYARAGYPADKFEREMNMNAHAGARTAVFHKAYRPDKHERALRPIPGLMMRNAWDFGKGYPARVWFQRTLHNAVRVYASVVGESIQLRPFAEKTIGHELALFGDVFQSRRDYCDPAGNQDKDDGLKSVEVLRSFGWTPKWRGSRIEEGITALDDLLRADEPETGEPMFLIDPAHNRVLCDALRSEYRRDASGEIERRHPWIDAMDALRYGIVNTRSPERPRMVQTPVHFDPVSGYGRAPIPATAGGFR